MRDTRNARLLRRNESQSANAAVATKLRTTAALPLANESPGVSHAQATHVAVEATKTASTLKTDITAFNSLVTWSIGTISRASLQETSSNA